jgi:hypothetical protein
MNPEQLTSHNLVSSFNIMADPRYPTEEQTDAVPTIVSSSGSSGSQKVPLQLTEHAMTEHDILLGRGSGPNTQRGNTRLRELVWQVYIEELQDAAPRYEDFAFGHANGNRTSTFPLPSPVIKACICRRVLVILQARNAKFLRKVSLESIQSTEFKTHKKKRATSPSPPTTVYLVRNQHYQSFYAVAVSRQESKDKIRQALRFQMDQRLRREQEIRSSSSSADHLSGFRGGRGFIPQDHQGPEARLAKSEDLSEKRVFRAIAPTSGSAIATTAGPAAIAQALNTAVSSLSGPRPDNLMSMPASFAPVPVTNDPRTISQAVSVLLQSLSNNNVSALLQPSSLPLITTRTHLTPNNILDLLLSMLPNRGTQANSCFAPQLDPTTTFPRTVYGASQLPIQDILSLLSRLRGSENHGTGHRGQR